LVTGLGRSGEGRDRELKKAMNRADPLDATIISARAFKYKPEVVA
jgi:hypothetical protein